MSSIEDVIHFFEIEIYQTKQWLDDENMSPIFNGIHVGFKEAKKVKGTSYSVLPKYHR